MKLKYLAFLPVFALLAAPVFAQEATPSASRKDDRRETRCQIISLKLEQTVKNYETRKDLHIKEYQRLHDRLVTVAGNLAAKGVDTSKLTTDLATLNTMIAKLSTDYQAFINDLSASKVGACTLTLEQIKNNLADSRTQLQSFRKDSQAIHDFIQNTIRKDLLAIRALTKPTESAGKPTEKPEPSVTPKPTEAE